MTKIYLTTSILLVAVFTVAFLYFSNISAASRNNDKALSLIPNDAALILQFKNDKSIYDIFSDYTVFEAVIGKQRQEELSALKSVLLKSKSIFRASLGQDIFLSFHALKEDSVAFLWIMPLPQALGDREVIEALQENKSIQYKESGSGNKSIAEAYIPSLKRPFYIRISENILSGSFSRNLMEASIDDQEEKIGSKIIEEITRTSLQKQNTPVSVFINFNNSIPFLSNFFKNKLQGNFLLLNNFNALATLNMNFKSDALMFNGITQTDTNKQNYINLFLKQKAVRNPIKRVVPDNTANYIAYGVSDYAGFHRDLKGLLSRRKELDKLNETLILIRNENGIDPERDIKQYWANEFITFQLSTQEKFGAIELSNGRQMRFFMDLLSSEYSEDIRHLNYPGLLYYYFGDAFRQFNKPFYTIVDNQMIVSNSPTSLRRYLSRYNRKLLYSTDKFMSFDQLLADRSNISVFVHISNSGSNISSAIKPSYANIFKSKDYGLKDFYGLSFQWTGETDHFFTNFYAGYPQQPAANEFSGTDSLN